MNCSQILERKAKTNWEKAAFSPESLEAKLDEIRAESRLWAALKTSASPSSPRHLDRDLAQTPVSSPRWG